MFVVKIANIPIGIKNKNDSVEKFYEEYFTDEEPLFVVEASADDEEYNKRKYNIDPSEPYGENMSIFRAISERLAEYDAFLLHSSVIKKENRIYAISAESGVGKTTHTRLWVSEFGDEVKIINGDKPIVRLIDGKPFIFGTPWRGKEGYGENDFGELSGIAFIERALENRAYDIALADADVRFIKQVYLPEKNPKNLILTLKLVNKVLRLIKLIRLECNMKGEAAHVCLRAFEGK